MKDFRHGSKLFELSVKSHGNTLFRGWNANNSMNCELKMDGRHIEWMRVYCNKHWTKQYLDASFTSAVEVNDRKQFMEMTIHFLKLWTEYQIVGQDVLREINRQCRGWRYMAPRKVIVLVCTDVISIWAGCLQ